MGEKLYIWGDNTPYNTGENKTAQMKIKGRPVKMLALMQFLNFIRNPEYKADSGAIDNMSYATEIKAGKSSKLFDDRPYLIPYLVPESDMAILIIPGGGFAYKSTDVDGSEGEKIAKKLNNEGISAFVLWYRSNPYKMPVPLLDAQRAVRYIRFNAKEPGASPDKIGVMGFSAGGYLAAALALKAIPSSLPTDIGYEPDEVDKQDDSVNLASLVYPVLSFRANPGMLFATHDADAVMNLATRNAIQDEMDLLPRISKSACPQFISYGTADAIVNPDTTMKYGELLKKEGVPVKCLPVEKANHGYASNKENQEWFAECVQWIKAGFKSN